MATPTTLPATFVSGNVLTAAQMNALRGAFRILQVVQGTTNTTVTNSTSTQAATLLTATITPSENTNKILVLVSQSGCSKSSGNANNRFTLTLRRGATDISAIAIAALFTGTALTLSGNTINGAYLDSPATTSATTYATFFNNPNNMANVQVQANSENSTIILLEVSA